MRFWMRLGIFCAVSALFLFAVPIFLIKDSVDSQVIFYFVLGGVLFLKALSCAWNFGRVYAHNADIPHDDTFDFSLPKYEIYEVVATGPLHQGGPAVLLRRRDGTIIARVLEGYGDIPKIFKRDQNGLKVKYLPFPPVGELEAKEAKSLLETQKAPSTTEGIAGDLIFDDDSTEEIPVDVRDEEDEESLLDNALSEENAVYVEDWDDAEDRSPEEIPTQLKHEAEKGLVVPKVKDDGLPRAVPAVVFVGSPKPSNPEDRSRVGSDIPPLSGLI